MKSQIILQHVGNRVNNFQNEASDISYSYEFFSLKFSWFLDLKWGHTSIGKIIETKLTKCTCENQYFSWECLILLKLPPS